MLKIIYNNSAHFLIYFGIVGTLLYVRENKTNYIIELASGNIEVISMEDVEKWYFINTGILGEYD